MNRHRGLAFIAAILFAVQARAAATLIENFAGLPSIESVEIAPDGSKLAIVLSSGEDRMLAIKPLPSGVAQTYAMGEAKVRRLDWVGPERLVITTSRSGQLQGVIGGSRENLMGFDLNVTTRKLEPLMKKSLGGDQAGGFIYNANAEKVTDSLNILAGAPEVRVLGGKPTLFLRGVTFQGRYGVLTILKVNPDTGATDIVELGEPKTNDFVLDPDGHPIAKSDYDDETGRWTLRIHHGQGWKVSKTVEAFTERPFLAGLGRDGRTVVVGQSGETGLGLREIGVDGVWSDPLDVLGQDGMVHDPATHRLIGLYRLQGDDGRYIFFDPADQKAWDAVSAAFKGSRVKLESWSQDRTKIVVLVDSPTLGQAYALVDLATKRASYLGGRYQKLTQQDISSVRAIRFKAKDGLDLTGYLTVPHGSEAKNLPLVVFPHGGPASRDEPGFDWWAQAMANRGYAVLQVNFRGSEGFGWDFLKAGFGEWGRKMQTDLSDGVRYLAAEGTIDPKRVCIVGASYGGYAALAGATIDTGVYRCAASYGGVSDLKRMVAWSKTRSQASFRYWIRFMGAENGRDEVLTQLSPAAHGGETHVPVLLIHGRDDSVVPLEQSKIMADALEKAGKPVELVVLKGEDHWLSRGDTRIQTLASIIAFLEKHNPPN